eukprot:CAMPEP_0195511898 /NCGR_PEP_ID=MMETSP0794_2-20130614/4055_1 /TAXON_ID=515487 /ORGANISM="Stephanopyxis turris, Strain CCMP 815" /LENGTH=40 /DNA_ID= /DNA_START= /DNA_END= /DNA_ORIENTATION=
MGTGLSKDYKPLLPWGDQTMNRSTGPVMLMVIEVYSNLGG